MSDHYLRLIVGLTPPGRRYHITSAAAPRNRLVLFALAYLADEEGRCTVTLTDLSAITQLTAPVIRTALRELETQHGFVRTDYAASGPNTYQLDQATLRSHQFGTLRRTRFPDSIVVLEEHGLDQRCLNALRRSGIHTITDLGAVIAKYQRLPPDERTGFDHFLDTRGLGARSGRKILDVYADWQRHNADNTDQPTPTGELPPTAVPQQP